MSTSVMEKFKKIPNFKEILNGPSKEKLKEKENVVSQAYHLERLKMNEDFINGYIPLLQEIKQELEKKYLSPNIDKDVCERARLQASLLIEIDERVSRKIREGVMAQNFLEKQEKPNVG